MAVLQSIKTAKYPPRYDAGRKARLLAEVNFGVNDDLKEKEGEEGEDLPLEA